jgi:hypothetical protein
MTSYVCFYYAICTGSLKCIRPGSQYPDKEDQAMNEKEKREFYIATCTSCLIAQAMKSCSVCRFNVGLAEQVKPVDPIPVSKRVKQTEDLVLLFDLV